MSGNSRHADAARRRRLHAATWLLSAALALAGWASGAFHRPELAVADQLFHLRGTQHPDGRIVLVLIDDASLQAIGHFPFARSVHAQVIDHLKADGARVIAYDVVFAERTTPREDNALVRAIARAGNVVLAAAEATSSGTPNVLGGTPGAFGATAGSSDFPFDARGAIRRVPRAVGRLQSFAVAVARRDGRHVDTGAFARPGALIDYAGPAGTYPSVSFADVARGRVAPATFRNRIVVVGASDPNLQDVDPTPTAGRMSGPEIEANAIATVLDGLPLRDSPSWLQLPLILLLAALSPLAALRLGPARAALAAIGGALLYALSVLVAFDGGVQLPFVGPMAALAVGIPFTSLIGYLSAAHELDLRDETHRRELGEARARAIEAADDARRQVERDLHDGAQQQLVALRLDLTGARRRLDGAAPEILTLLEDAEQRLLGAVGSLRALASGTYPPALTDGGLDTALLALGEQLPANVSVRGTVGRRLDPRLEAIAYFFASEGLANAMKHAEAAHVDVAVALVDEVLGLSVRDDGRGGADPAGGGLSGLRERVAAYGGTMRVTSPAGGGTMLEMTLPVGDQPAGGPSAAARR